MRSIPYSDFISIATASKVPLFYQVKPIGYYIWTETVSISTLILTGSEDCADFEANYKALANKPIIQDIKRVLGSDSLSTYPFCSIFTATANTTTTVDVTPPDTLCYKGGVLFSDNAEVGDTISIELHHVQAGLIKVYIPSWGIMPGQRNDFIDESISATLDGTQFFFKLKYTSTSTTVSPKVVLNFLAYKPDAV